MERYSITVTWRIALGNALAYGFIMQSGHIEGIAGQTYYENVVGPGVPLVCVHGGPGFTSYYLEPLRERLTPQRGVVLYDQAGCGRSRVVGARKSFTIESFVSELEGIIDAIGAKTVDLLGHSFGGIVIGEYALRHPERVRKAVFASVSIDIPRWLEDAERLVNKMPLLQKMVLKEGHRSGSYGAPAYLAALSEYYTHHVYGFAGPLPDVLKLAEREADPQTYQVMWGPNEIVVSGVCRDYSLTPRLSQLACPTLFTCGRFDEATPEAHEYFRSQVANGQLRVFEKSAHHAQLSELDDYAEVLAEFLA